MNGIYILLTIFIYFGLLLLVAKLPAEEPIMMPFSGETASRPGM